MTGPARSKTQATLTRTLRAGVIAAGLTACSIGAYWGVVQSQGNFHTVEEGAFYRSAQLAKDELQKAVRDHGIRTILNLRGAHPGEPWYNDEVLGIIRHAPRPLLVHCKSGADRTGLVSALYRFAVEGKNKNEADAQLTVLYGHFPYLTSRTRAMDDSFWAFVGKTNGAKIEKY